MVKRQSEKCDADWRPREHKTITDQELTKAAILRLGSHHPTEGWKSRKLMVEANRGAEVRNGHVKWREDRVKRSSLQQIIPGAAAL
jgi:hypothetical protein